MLGHKRNAYYIHMQSVKTQSMHELSPLHWNKKHSSQYGDKCRTQCIMRYGALHVTAVRESFFMPEAKSACHKRRRKSSFGSSPIHNLHVFETLNLYMYDKPEIWV